MKANEGKGDVIYTNLKNDDIMTTVENMEKA